MTSVASATSVARKLSDAAETLTEMRGYIDATIAGERRARQSMFGTISAGGWQRDTNLTKLAQSAGRFTNAVSDIERGVKEIRSEPGYESIVAETLQELAGGYRAAQKASNREIVWSPEYDHITKLSDNAETIAVMLRP